MNIKPATSTRVRGVRTLLAKVLVVVMAGCATREFSVATARLAAEHGNAKAEYFLSKSYANGRGVRQDYIRATAYLRQAAEQGYAPAQSDLGVFYAQGKGVPQDFAEAVKWFRRAADQGDMIAEYCMGISHQLGQGVATNMDEAVKWYRRAAIKDMLEAELVLGDIYLGGRGLPADYKLAGKWYQKAATQHSAVAVNALGYIYEEGGFGVSKDLPRAVLYYQQAAIAGNGKGQMNLGRMYLNGFGVQKDPIEAYKWLYLASTNGDALAGHFMDEVTGTTEYGDYLGPHLTGDQVKEAIRRAHGFQSDGQ